MSSSYTTNNLCFSSKQIRDLHDLDPYMCLIEDGTIIKTSDEVLRQSRGGGRVAQFLTIKLDCGVVVDVRVDISNIDTRQETIVPKSLYEIGERVVFSAVINKPRCTWDGSPWMWNIFAHRGEPAFYVNGGTKVNFAFIKELLSER